MRATKPLSFQPIVTSLEVSLNTFIDLKSSLKIKKKLVLKKNENKAIDLAEYVDLKGPVFDIYSSKVKGSKNERLIG